MTDVEPDTARPTAWPGLRAVSKLQIVRNQVSRWDDATAAVVGRCSAPRAASAFAARFTASARRWTPVPGRQGQS
jgi:hypothetical protein